MRCSERTPMPNILGCFEVLRRLTVHSVALSFGLADLDDLHAEQLYLGAAVLQHLLGCTQQLTVL